MIIKLRKLALIFSFLPFCLLCSTPIFSTDVLNVKKNEIIFENLFSEWTKAFNNKDLKASCSLFRSDVKAKYRGLPEKNYDDICNGFDKIFKEKNKDYQYSFEVHDVFSQENLAVVRITWYLQIKENGLNKSVVQDEGMDVLEKDQQDRWQIVNYLAFQE